MKSIEYEEFMEYVLQPFIVFVEKILWWLKNLMKSSYTITNSCEIIGVTAVATHLSYNNGSWDGRRCGDVLF